VYETPIASSVVKFMFCALFAFSYHNVYWDHDLSLLDPES
jgi:hypothetical protein